MNKNCVCCKQNKEPEIMDFYSTEYGLVIINRDDICPNHFQVLQDLQKPKPKPKIETDDKIKRACIICTTEFEPKNNNSKTCSKQCSITNRDNIAKRHQKEKPEYYRSKTREYYHKDPAKARLRQKENYQKYKEYYTDYKKQWQKDNREKCNEYVKKYRAKQEVIKA